MGKVMSVIVSSAVVVDGEIVRPGREVSLPEGIAISLLKRGKVKVIPGRGVDVSEDISEDREALEAEYKELGGRPQDEWSDDELIRRIEERREKVEK